MAFLFALCAVGSVAWLYAAPFLPPSLSALTYAVGSLICHQIPSRSFHVAGFQLPVCARCLGIYTGIAVGASAAVILSTRDVRSNTWWTPNAARRVALAGAVPTLLSAALELVGLWRTTNVERAVMGAPLGLAMSFVVVGVLATLNYRKDDTRT